MYLTSFDRIRKNVIDDIIQVLFGFKGKEKNQYYFSKYCYNVLTVLCLNNVQKCCFIDWLVKSWPHRCSICFVAGSAEWRPVCLSHPRHNDATEAEGNSHIYGESKSVNQKVDKSQRDRYLYMTYIYIYIYKIKVFKWQASLANL